MADYDGTVSILEQQYFFRFLPSRTTYGGRKQAPGLLDRYDMNYLLTQMIVCYSPIAIPTYATGYHRRANNNQVGLHLFTCFDSYAQFYDYMLKLPSCDRCFYEVIPDNKRQKPHFDIDIKLEDSAWEAPSEEELVVKVLAATKKLDDLATRTIDGLIFSIIAVCRQKGVRIEVGRDIILCNSHGARKRSFHLVICNYCHTGAREAKAFYQAVATYMNQLSGYKECTGYVDHKVYNPNQQFRIMGSQKANSNRPKIMMFSFIYMQREFTHEIVDLEPHADKRLMVFRAFAESLVSLDAGCETLPQWEVMTMSKFKGGNYEDRRFTLMDLETLPEDDVAKCLAMMEEKVDISYYVADVQGHLIDIRRNAGTSFICPVCSTDKEPHEHTGTHPFIFIINRRVYFKCRRNPEEKSLLLGMLDIDNTNPIYDTGFGDNDTMDNSGVFVGAPVELRAAKSIVLAPCPAPTADPTPDPKPKVVVPIMHINNNVLARVTETTVPATPATPAAPADSYEAVMARLQRAAAVRAQHMRKKPPPPVDIRSAMDRVKWTSGLQ